MKIMCQGDFRMLNVICLRMSKVNLCWGRGYIEINLSLPSVGIKGIY